MDILEHRGKKKKARYEISGDLTEARRLASKTWRGDNGDLEDELRAKAKAARRKIEWSSEADTFVAFVADLPTARWIVDAVRAAPGK